MSKILVFGDLHLDRNKFLPEEEQLSIHRSVVKQIADLASKVDITIFLGDWFNKLSETLPKSVIMESANMIRSISATTPMYMITGNHDMYREKSLLTSFNSEYVIPIVIPTNISIGRKEIWLEPYGYATPEEARGMLFGHFGITGSKVGSGYLNLDEEVPLSKLQNFNLVMCGHYHTRQILNHTRGQIVMHPGSVMAHSFSDSEEDKGVYIIDTDKQTWEPEGVEFIKIDSPKYITRIANKGNIKEITKEAAIFKNNYRFLVSDDSLDIQNLPTNVRVDWEIENKPTEHYSEEDKINNLEADIYEFIEKSNTALDKKRLVLLAKDMLEKV
jgi:DNA repair exonuclease SbcCD nuclease subunit